MGNSLMRTMTGDVITTRLQNIAIQWQTKCRELYKTQQ